MITTIPQRPKYRGALHQIITITLIILTIFQTTLKPFYIKSFILGKLPSYLISSFLHSKYTTNLYLYNFLLYLDFMLINVSIFYTPIIEPYFDLDYYIYYNINLCLVLLSWINILHYNMNIRLILTFVQFIYAISYIGFKSSFNYLWIISTFLYVLSFLFYLPTAKLPILFPNLYWHKTNIYGYHEDFYFILLLAEIMMYLNNLNYLKVIYL